MLGRDVAVALISAPLGRQAARVAARRRGAEEVEVSPPGQGVAQPVITNAQAIDLFKQPRGVRVERLSRRLGWCTRLRAVRLPRGAR